VVQSALRNVIEPIFECKFAEHSYGFRPGRGCKGALRRVNGLIGKGYTWVVDADLKSYFDTIPHERLMQRIKERIADGKVLNLIEQFLKQGVMEELGKWQPTERGTPQGAVISPLLANTRSGWRRRTVGCECACEASCVITTSCEAVVNRTITNAGPIPTLLSGDCFL
jgi:RNA-directed DNA polymerase